MSLIESSPSGRRPRRKQAAEGLDRRNLRWPAGSAAPATPALFDRSAAVPPGPVPSPHRPSLDQQVACDLADLAAAGEPPGGLQPEPPTPLLPGGRVPAPLHVPHAPVISKLVFDVTT